MNKNQPGELPLHIYHRIYRFIQRNVEPERIALTLDLPLKTVQRVLSRFSQGETLEEITSSAEQQNVTFLDIYQIPKIRYIVVDFSGWITEKHIDKLKQELDRLSVSQWKAIAFLMRDAYEIDEAGINAILNFHDTITSRGRICAILDPSADVDAYIISHGIEERIQIFGTEKSFENEAFSHRQRK